MFFETRCTSPSPPTHHGITTTTSAVHQHITDNTSTHRPPHRRQLHHTFIVQRLLLNFYFNVTFLICVPYTRISIVTAVRFVIVDFKEMNEWMNEPNSQKFYPRWGIHRLSVSRIIHKDLRLKCCKKRCAQQLTEMLIMHALFSVCSLRDDNVIINKATGRWKLKHANSILWSFEYFYQISSKSIHIILRYTVSNFLNFLKYSVAYRSRTGNCIDHVWSLCRWCGSGLQSSE